MTPDQEQRLNHNFTILENKIKEFRQREQPATKSFATMTSEELLKELGYDNENPEEESAELIIYPVLGYQKTQCDGRVLGDRAFVGTPLKNSPD